MAIGIGIGISRFPFSGAPAYWRWVEQCESGGVDSIWQTDRLVSQEPMLECVATMAALAGATERIRFGMNVASIALRDPLLTAKQLATIDVLSEGRVLPAFGLGSALSKDYVATGTPTRRRGKRANEALELVHRLWTEETVCYQGEFFQYENAAISPKPVNSRIPLWIGGSSVVAMKRTARYGTGWLGGIDTPEQSKVMVDGIKAALRETGRSIDDDHYGATFSFRFGRADAATEKRQSDFKQARSGKDPSRYMVVGDAEAIIARVHEYIEAGCSKFVLMPMAGDDAGMTEQTRLLINEVLPAF
jgi:probable F420-dependent oxidoreductase